MSTINNSLKLFIDIYHKNRLNESFQNGILFLKALNL